MNGLRINEALRADLTDLDHDRGHRTLNIVRKGGKHVTIPLAPRTGRALDLYIGEQASGPLFLGLNGERAPPGSSRASTSTTRPVDRSRIVREASLIATRAASSQDTALVATTWMALSTRTSRPGAADIGQTDDSCLNDRRTFVRNWVMAPPSITTSCSTTSATRRSRKVLAASVIAARAASSQDSLLVPINSTTLYTLLI